MSDPTDGVNEGLGLYLTTSTQQIDFMVPVHKVKQMSKDSTQKCIMGQEVDKVCHLDHELHLISRHYCLY